MAQDGTEAGSSASYYNGGGPYYQGGSTNPIFSPDGSKVAFLSYGNLSGGSGVNPFQTVYVKDLASGAVVLGSTARNDDSPVGVTGPIAFSPDSRSVAFASGWKLTPDDTSTYYVDIFRKDLATGWVSMVTVDQNRYPAEGNSHHPLFSPDGTRIAFTSFAPNLPPGDVGDDPDVFVKDLTDPVFGARVHDVSSQGGRVFAFYDAILDRKADPLGLEHVAAHSAVLSNADLAQAFLSSAEGQARYAGLDNRGFVDALYHAALNRAPDPGAQSYVNTLNDGASRAAVAADIALSGEHLDVLKDPFAAGVWVPSEVASSVARLYWGLLDRAPDAAGLRDWSGAVSGKTSIADFAQVSLHSNEYIAKYGASSSDQDFITHLYNGAVGRQPDDSGLANYLNELHHGVSRGQVAVEISESPEAQNHLMSAIETGWHLT